MPITAAEFSCGERTTTRKKGESKSKTAPTTEVTKKTVSYKGQVKAYGQYGQRKFFVKFLEGPDDKAMFQESHWGVFQSGDVIEFESKFNSENLWHGIHKNHFVRVVESKFDADGEIEIEVEVGYVTKWKDEVCKAILNDVVDGIKTIEFTKDTNFNDDDFDYAKCKIFGSVEPDGLLVAETVDVVEKKHVYYHHEIPLCDLTFGNGEISYVKADDFRGSIAAEWSREELNEVKDSLIGCVHIYGNYRVHGRFVRGDDGEWQERVWYVLNPETSKLSIQDEYLDDIMKRR